MEPSDAPAGIGHNKPPSTSERLVIEFKELIAEVDEFAASATRLRDDLKDGQIDFDDTEGREATLGRVVETGKDARKLAKRIEQTRLDTTQPLRTEVEQINKFFSFLEDRMKKVKSFAEDVAGEYDRKRRAEEARRAAEAARLAEEEARRKMEEAAAAEHSVLSDVALNEAAEAESRAQKAAHVATSAGSTPSRTGSGTVSSTSKYDFRIVDVSRIPPHLIVAQLNLKDIEKALRSHVTKFKDAVTVPGVDIFPVTKTVLR